MIYQTRFARNTKDNTLNVQDKIAQENFEQNTNDNESQNWTIIPHV